MWLIMMLCFAILVAIAAFCMPLAIFMAALMVYAYSQLGVGDMLAGALGYQDKATMEDDAKAGFKDPTTIAK